MNDPEVLYANGKRRKLKNLAWLTKRAKDVHILTVQIYSKREQHRTGQMCGLKAEMIDGSVFQTDFGSIEVCIKFTMERRFKYKWIVRKYLSSTVEDAALIEKILGGK